MRHSMRHSNAEIAPAIPRNPNWKPPIFKKRLLHCAVCLIACVASAQTVASPAKHESHQYNSERMLAPYVDMGRLPNNLPQLRADSGIRFFTLAFVNANQGCTPAWPGSQLVASDSLISGYVNKLREAGGDVIIAFGGYDGTELAQACDNVASLQAAYQKVVDKYKAKILDFDVEHLAIEDQASIDRRNLALKNLAQANPGLQINFTLPATPAGLTAPAMNVLRSVVAQGAPVRIVNVMTMDYGLTALSNDMGANAVSAIEGAQNQLRDVGLHAKLGITPMLGLNDSAGETFTLANAASVLSYALKNQNVALLAFWSVGRDNGSCAAVVSPTCSGLTQEAWEFVHAFAAFH